MMNRKLLTLGSGLALLLFSGCAADRLKPAEALPGSNVRNAPPELSLTEMQIIERAAAQPPAVVAGEGWRPMFDGHSLAGWRSTAFGGPGRAAVQKGLILLSAGGPFTGINWTNEAPKVNYELSLEAMRVTGSDFFCGLTFPVQDSFCSLIVGGWGGTLVGLSNLDGADASENETTQYVSFETGRWYRIRLRVTESKIEAWIEQKKVVNLTTTGRKVSLRFGDIELSKPLGIASWDTGAALREIKIRTVTAPDSPQE
jgi:hypothetical protein